jgi:hypothetical protein
MLSGPATSIRAVYSNLPVKQTTLVVIVDAGHGKRSVTGTRDFVSLDARLHRFANRPGKPVNAVRRIWRPIC